MKGGAACAVGCRRLRNGWRGEVPSADRGQGGIGERSLCASAICPSRREILVPTRTAFLPMGTKVRELDSRILQAACLAGHGFSTYLGESRVVASLAKVTRGGVYFAPVLTPASAPRLAALARLGHTILAWDEEGLVYPDAAWYVEDRLADASMSYVDTFLAWGEVQADDLRRARPTSTVHVEAVGNPRIDLLREPVRSIYAARAAEIRSTFGPFILVNTNFDLVNHADGSEVFLDRLRQAGRIVSRSDEERFAAWAEFRLEMFDSFKGGIELLHDRIEDRKIVVRPHPSEDLRAWEELAAGLERVCVEPATEAVMPWVIASDALVHNSCTTAVEAFALGVPTVAYRPRSDLTDFESALPNDLSVSCPTWDDVISVIEGLDDAWRPERRTAARSLASRYVANLDGPLAADQIAAFARAAVDRRGDRPRLAQMTDAIRANLSIVEQRTRQVRHRQSVRRNGKTVEQSQRFPGLTIAEVRDRLAQIGLATGREAVVDEVEAGLFRVRSVAC